MKFPAAATKNKSGLEFREFLVENKTICAGPFLHNAPNDKRKELLH